MRPIFYVFIYFFAFQVAGQNLSPVSVGEESREAIPDLTGRRVSPDLGVTNAKFLEGGVDATGEELVFPAHISQSTPVILFFMPGSGIEISDMASWMQTPGAAGCTAQVCTIARHLRSRIRVFIVSAQEPHEIRARLYDLAKAGKITEAQALQLRGSWLADPNLRLARHLGVPILDHEAADRPVAKRISLVLWKAEIEAQEDLPFPADSGIESLIRFCRRLH